MICAKEAKIYAESYNKSMLLAVKFEAFKVTSDNDKSRGVLQITI